MWIWMLLALAGPTGVEAEIGARVLKVLSLRPAALAEANKEHLFLNNPTWTAPFVDLDGGFFCPIPQMACMIFLACWG